MHFWIRQPTHVQQGHNGQACGAASCLYILKMLRLDEPTDTIDSVFRHVTTLPGTQRLGSTPAAIAAYLEKRTHGKRRLRFRRWVHANYGGKPHLWALHFGLDKYEKVHPGFRPNRKHVILRFLTYTNSMNSHFVVETHFAKNTLFDHASHCQIADPENTTGIEDVKDYETWLAGNPTRQATGLDLVLSEQERGH